MLFISPKDKPAPNKVAPDRYLFNNSELGQINRELGRINPVLGRINPELGQINTDLGQMNPELAQINPDLGQINPELGQINPELAGILGSCARNVSHRTPLYIGGLMPVLNGTFQPGLISQAGSKQAVEDINNRSDVLPGYEIILEWADTEGNVPSALDRLYEFMYTPPVKVAIYGPAFSSVAAVLAEVIGKWSIVEWLRRIR
ncbi:uncharacterized protein LOC117296120 [Asterias rubens]|uniref:uncharacterized protein LOC117296120 n=1 Tax=Asterias rubens TaxID=7604 RepID=UPI001455B066|nr:uncharacterized protein LOC117296120 [Asterias rubens]